MPPCRSFFRSIALTALLLLAFVSTQAQAQAPQPPRTIYLIRHAEKLTDGREDLSPAGFARAAVLSQIFLPPAGSARVQLARPQFLFATHASAHSNRPVETITPMAAALNLPIEHTIMNDDYAQLATLLLGGKYAGSIVLVSWHHGNLPNLARALGAVPPYTPWPEQQFDRIWRIDYRDGHATLTDLPQQLMPGDSH